MPESSETALVKILLDLAGLLGIDQAGLDGEQLEARIIGQMAEDELLPAQVPAWLVHALRAILEEDSIGWVDFARPNTDDTPVFDFIRNLPQLLPIILLDDVESWTFQFPTLSRELCISIEASCYKVGPIGHTWD
jgi:hypothetical protein